MPERNLSDRRVALYGRVSKDVPRSRSVDDQLGDGRAWVERVGATNAGEYRDDGIGASAHSKGVREDWTRLLADLAAGRFDLLWTWEISRATRERGVWAALVGVCVERGILLAERDRVYDPADPDDAFQMDLQAILAVREVGKLRSRLERAARNRRARGEPHGRIHDGLKIVYDPETGQPVRRVLDPERAPIMREIADRVLAGESCYGIADDLNKRGLRTSSGQMWRGQNIARRLVSPSLAGLVEHDGRLIEAQWPGVITREQHDRIVTLMADPTRKKNRRGPHVKFLVSGIATCAECGGGMRVINRRRTDGSAAPTYSCATNYCTSRLAEPVDELVSVTAVRYLSRPDILAELADGDDDADRAAANARAAELTAQLDRARNMLRSGQLSLESLAHLEGWALPEIAQCELRARPPHLPGVLYSVAGPDAADRWEATPISARREIVRSLFTIAIRKSSPHRAGQPFDPTTIAIEPRNRVARTTSSHVVNATQNGVETATQ